MISFVPCTKTLLPYDRAYYIDFLDDDNITSRWQGISFHLYSDKECSFSEFFDAYLPVFENTIMEYRRKDYWIINHDDKDMPWFPTENKNLATLRSLFKQHNISNTFRGYITLAGEDLLVYARDIISYPYCMFDEEGMLYKNLDISHSIMPLIIKISGHLTIDFISTDKHLLRSLHDQYSKNFVIKEYWGSSIH